MDFTMKLYNNTIEFIGNPVSLLRKCLFRVLSVGPIPTHIAFIMDGNRRYAAKHNLREGAGHKVGFLALISLLKYCYEMGLKYVTIFAFSVDNFRRRPDEVQYVMDLMEEKLVGVLEEERFLNRLGVRINFIGNLRLLNESTRLIAEKLMSATAKNDKIVLSICVAYSSSDELMHAIQKACKEKQKPYLNKSNEGVTEVVKDRRIDQESEITVTDIERHMYMYMAAVPDPDILVRTSGITRLSNFLCWQTVNCHLYSPGALWPEMSFWDLVWGVVDFQRVHPYLEKKRKST